MTEKKGLFGLFGGKEEKKELDKADARIKDLEGKLRKEELDKGRAEILKKQQEMLKEQAEKKAVKKHVVVSGDTLSGIAKKYYNDAGKYLAIYEANKEIIGDNPDLIQPGMELIIPKL